MMKSVKHESWFADFRFSKALRAEQAEKPQAYWLSKPGPGRSIDNKAQDLTLQCSKPAG